ncbi:MAG: glycosyltransferase family 39 protein [Thermosynechococcaceae cyanobacterium]
MALSRLPLSGSKIWKEHRLWFSILTLALLCGLVFLWQLGDIGLIDETEPLFVEAARQMQETGDWVTPYFNGVTRFDKPPLIYWLMAVADRLIGVNEWAARLPSALSAISLISLSFYTLQCFGCPSPSSANSETTSEDFLASALMHPRPQRLGAIAWMGTAILILTPVMFVWGRIGVSDMLLSGCMGMALLAFFIGYAHPNQPQQKRWYLLCFVLSALAVLTKGPVGIVLPGLIIGSFLLYQGCLRQVLREMPLLLGSSLFLLLTVPWYVLVILANGEAYLDSFFGYHNFDRFTSTVNHHAGPWYFYFLVVLLGFAPWSVWLPWAMARLRFFNVAQWRQQPRSEQLGLFALHWFGGIFIFFTVAATKLPSYVLPLMPAAAILVGGLAGQPRLRLRQHQWSAVVSLVAHLILLAMLAWACFYGLQWLGKDPDMPNFPQRVRQSGVMITGAMIWAGAAIASLILLWRRLRWLWTVDAIAMVLFIALTLLPMLQLVDSQRQLPLRQIATVIRTQRQAEPIIYSGQKPSLVFYTQRPVIYIHTPEIIDKEIQQQLESSQPSVLVVGLKERLQKLNLDPQHSVLLKAAGAYQLIRIQRS